MNFLSYRLYPNIDIYTIPSTRTVVSEYMGDCSCEVDNSLGHMFELITGAASCTI